MLQHDSSFHFIHRRRPLCTIKPSTFVYIWWGSQMQIIPMHLGTIKSSSPLYRRRLPSRRGFDKRGMVLRMWHVRTCVLQCNIMLIPSRVVLYAFLSGLRGSGLRGLRANVKSVDVKTEWFHYCNDTHIIKRSSILQWIYWSAKAFDSAGWHKEWQKGCKRSAVKERRTT